jgi:SAM-dependent methyltransferase
MVGIVPPAAAARHAWCVDLIDPAPDAQVLELGMGPGVASTLIADRLTGGGLLVGLDRSEKAVAAATKRNQHHVDAGRARFVCSPIGDAAAVLGGHRFDHVFASNVVALINDRAPEHLAVVRDLLLPGGRLTVAMQLFDQSEAPRVGDAAASALLASGFHVTSTEEPAGEAGPGVAVLATR